MCACVRARAALAPGSRGCRRWAAHPHARLRKRTHARARARTHAQSKLSVLCEWPFTRTRAQSKLSVLDEWLAPEERDFMQFGTLKLLLMELARTEEEVPACVREGGGGEEAVAGVIVGGIGGGGRCE